MRSNPINTILQQILLIRLHSTRHDSQTITKDLIGPWQDRQFEGVINQNQHILNSGRFASVDLNGQETSTHHNKLRTTIIVTNGWSYPGMRQCLTQHYAQR